MKTVTQASDELGISTKTIYKYINITLHHEYIAVTTEERGKALYGGRWEHKLKYGAKE